MQVFELVGFSTGVSEEGVNFIQPQDAFQSIKNGYIYRQVLQSRAGMQKFSQRLADNSRVFLISEYILPDSTKELLVADANFLYKFNATTKTFDQIPFGGSMAAYPGFNIGDNALYISSTAYPNKANIGRFVFTGNGITANSNGSAIFFYNGSEVLDYTDTGDNPDYANPPQGPLQRSKYVIWFNERINFISPTIDSTAYSQGTLYSGIRDSSGNGDKFNVPGSGLFQADTSQDITGVSILGQIMIHNYTSMAYTMEKTRDAFNPYFGRAVPGVLGTNADFSSVAWNDTIRSMGKTGVLGTDGRENLRVDNKIPYFTNNEIDQLEFNLIYGGFDRINGQFLWSYKDSASTSETQDRVLSGNYEENTWSVYDLRVSVFGQTDVGDSLTWDNIDETADESWAQWDTTEQLWDRVGLTNEVQKTLAGDNLGFIYDINQTYNDYFSNISAITQGDTTTLTITENAFQAGDLVIIQDVVGLEDIDGISGINNYDSSVDNPIFNPWTIISATPTSIEINCSSSDLTAYVSGGSIEKVISFEATTIPFNPWRNEGRRVYISHLEALIDNTGASLMVDVYDDEDDAPFKQNVLMRPDPLSTKKRQWINMSVNQESNFITFALKQQSPSAQLRITSLRIHCQPGGFTSG